MLLIGLTGGIGSGKSTASGLLVERGAELVDADAITREVQQPGEEVFERIVERFGPSVVRTDGSLDRQWLADRVFADGAEDELADLNGIVHPAVGVRIAERLAALAHTDRIVLLDVPLMVESGRATYQALLVVDCPPETAVGRLVSGRGFDPADARNRIARQATREERLAQADFVIDNSGTLDDLRAEVDRAWTWMEELAEREGRGGDEDPVADRDDGQDLGR